jgi:hypothetical protein
MFQSLPKLEAEVIDWEQKFKALEALDSLKEKVKRLKNEMAWAFVTEKEKVCYKYAYIFTFHLQNLNHIR